MARSWVGLTILACLPCTVVFSSSLSAHSYEKKKICPLYYQCTASSSPWLFQISALAQLHHKEDLRTSIFRRMPAPVVTCTYMLCYPSGWTTYSRRHGKDVTIAPRPGRLGGTVKLPVHVPTSPAEIATVDAFAAALRQQSSSAAFPARKHSALRRWSG